MSVSGPEAEVEQQARRVLDLHKHLPRCLRIRLLAEQPRRIGSLGRFREFWPRRAKSDEWRALALH